MRPARDLLRVLVAYADRHGLVSASAPPMLDAKEWIRRSDEMTSAPPEAAEFTTTTRRVGDRVRLQLHGQSFDLALDEARAIGAGLAGAAGGGQ